MTHKNKFGMFIHWGIYSLTGIQDQALARFSLDKSEYEALAKEFNPVNYNPEKWVKLAKSAGMKYICFTTKHHDGFCMWNTKYSKLQYYEHSLRQGRFKGACGCLQKTRCTAFALLFQPRLASRVRI